MSGEQASNGAVEVIGERGVVAAGHIAEAEAGIRILAEGGNAVDAVVAAAFTGFVVEPASCGLGGYGHLSIFLADRNEFLTIDHYVRAPLGARPDMFSPDLTEPETYYGWPQVVGRLNDLGSLAPAVPGAVAGLCVAHQLCGRLPLSVVLEPAIEAAQAGIPVTPHLLSRILDRLEDIRAVPEAQSWLLRNGAPPAPVGPDGLGDRLDGTDLARTLRKIALHGVAGFYSGSVAEAIARAIAAHGGLLSTRDLEAYKPKILREKTRRYREYSYITGNDPLGYETLNILDQFDLRRFDPDGLQFRHLAAEAMGHSFVDNMHYYGDPDHTRSPIGGLCSRGFAAQRAAGIRLDRAAHRPISPGDPWPYETLNEAPSLGQQAPSVSGLDGTSQMTAADRNGNVAALITSLTGPFGSLVIVPGTGVILNNAMRNFDPRPGHSNSIAPGKMPIFAAPTIVAAENNRACFGACGSGGYRILSGVLHTMIDVLDFGMDIGRAVGAPRVHCQGSETIVDERIPKRIRSQLADMGHIVVTANQGSPSFPFGRVSGIWIDRRSGLLHASSNPNWASAALGF